MPPGLLLTLDSGVPGALPLSRKIMKELFRRPWRCLSSVGLLLLLSGVVFPGATGTIKGRILDPDGNPLKDVTVTLTDKTRGQTYTMKTDKKGNYYQMGIDPAEYQLKFEKARFQSLEGTVSITGGKENVFDGVLAREIKKPVKPAWEEKNIRAHDLYVEGKFEEALALYREILSVDPNVAFIHFNAGNCYYHLKNYEAAYQSFHEAVRLKPDFFEAYTNLANTSGRLKKFDEAIPLIEDAIRAYPTNGTLFSSLGLLYLNSGEGAKAADCLEKSVALNPTNPTGYNSLGIAYTQTGDYARAIENYEKYLTLISDAKEIERVKGIIEQLKPLVKK
jgi:tetratricopeptide (TPR) repeat protein